MTHVDLANDPAIDDATVTCHQQLGGYGGMETERCGEPAIATSLDLCAGVCPACLDWLLAQRRQRIHLVTVSTEAIAA